MISKACEVISQASCLFPISGRLYGRPRIPNIKSSGPVKILNHKKIRISRLAGRPGPGPPKRRNESWPFRPVFPKRNAPSRRSV
jgi:hypothetical protein